MKRNLSPVWIVAAVCAALAPAPLGAANVEAGGPSSGQVDLGTFAPPEGGGTFVEVHLPRNLIALAARLAAKEEPDVAKLLQDLQSVRVNVIGLDDANRAGLAARSTSLRADLIRRGWQQVVTVREQDNQVDVLVKLDGDEVIQGVTVTVMEGNRQAVFVNVVGNIRPEQLAIIGERFGIDPLKHIGKRARG